MTVRQSLPLLLFLLLRLISSVSCGYSSCPTTLKGLINVHFVAHTHNDVGWLKTVDQYYYGHRNDIQRAGVQYILDSVITALVEDRERRFIYVESAFFWRWWGEQNEQRKQLVRQLLAEGRLEFIGGGWSMNDEAAAHYSAIIDNMSFGMKFLADNFGEAGRPRVAWQIDPFGHSREQANIFAHMGFDGLFFGRLDYADKEKRMETNTMEMIWAADETDKTGDSDLFTGALFHAYSPPPGFCFDSLCRDVIMDDERLEDYNFDIKISEFANYTHFQAKSYATNNLIMTMGEDFNYGEANMWFKNMDKIRNYFNKNQDKFGINILYSTPSCYLKSLNDAELSWPRKTDDFFPYASDPHAYWTGYFTSRSSLKGMIRSANSLLQSCKQLHAVAGGLTDPRLEAAKRSVAVNQHHDAVTGTAKQHVTDDYALRLARGMEGCSELMLERLGQSSGCQLSSFCPLLNISQCAHSESRSDLVVTVYNPRTVLVHTPVRLPVTAGGDFTVRSVRSGEEVETQVVPVPQEVLSLPGRESKANYELVFMAEVPALAYSVFSVQRQPGPSRIKTEKIQFGGKTPRMMENNKLQAHFNRNGVLTRIKTRRGGGGDEVIKISQHFSFYRGAVGNNSQPEFRASGAYIFRPVSQQPTPVGDPVSAYLIRGPVVQEVHQKFNDWCSQVVRLYRGQNTVEFEWLIGPLPAQLPDSPGLEVITRYSTDLDSQESFSTDSNGRFMISRRRNFRPTWKLNLTEPVSSNYYPVTSRISLTEQTNSVAEERRQLWVMTDRAQGGSSLKSGQMELMLHRRLFNDDAFGVGEALNETAFGAGLVVRGKHSLLPCVDTALGCEAQSRLVAETNLMKPVVLLGNSCHVSNFRNISANQDIFPPTVKLLSMEAWTNTSILIRLENIGLQNSETVSVSGILAILGQSVSKAVETTLDGNLDIKDLRRLSWNDGKNEIGKMTQQTPIDLDKITLKPKQIRTFQLIWN